MSWLDDVLAQIQQQQLQQQQQQQQQQLGAAARQPIPGLTGPTDPAAGVIPRATPVGPPQQPIPGPQQPAPGGQQMLQPFMASGPYGAQAARLAGLLNDPAGSPPNAMPQRPVMGGGLLGGTPRGYRIPYRGK